MRPTRYTTPPQNCDIWSFIIRSSWILSYIFVSIIRLTICDYPALCIESDGFSSEAGDFPPRAIGDIATARQSFLLAPTMRP